MDILASPYFILSALLLAGLGVLELTSRTTKLPSAVIRKTGHVGLALVIAMAAFLWHKELFIAIGFGFTLIALLLRRLPLSSLGHFKSTSHGDVLFPLGVGISALLSPSTTAFILVMLIIGFADTAAYSIGKSLASKKIYGSKTIAGTAAFAVVAFSILLVGQQPLIVALVGAVTLAATELFSGHGSDNLTVPITASLLLLIASHLL